MHEDLLKKLMVCFPIPFDQFIYAYMVKISFFYNNMPICVGDNRRGYIICDLDFSHQFSNWHPLSRGVFSTQTCAELADTAIEP